MSAKWIWQLSVYFFFGGGEVLDEIDPKKLTSIKTM